MATPIPENVNYSRGIDEVFIYISEQIPIFMPLVLLSFFLIIWLGGYLSEKRLSGKEDLLKWFAIAGFINFGAALVMTIGQSFISLDILVLSFAVMIFGFILMLITRRD